MLSFREAEGDAKPWEMRAGEKHGVEQEAGPRAGWDWGDVVEDKTPR